MCVKCVLYLYTEEELSIWLGDEKMFRFNKYAQPKAVKRVFYLTTSVGWQTQMSPNNLDRDRPGPGPGISLPCFIVHVGSSSGGIKPSKSLLYLGPCLMSLRGGGSCKPKDKRINF